MNGLAADIVGQEIADRVGKVWGLGSDTTKDPGPWEGEQRNMWKPTQQEGLWFHGGNLHQSRYYSLYLALPLKARAEGIPTPCSGCRRCTTRRRFPRTPARLVPAHKDGTTRAGPCNSRILQEESLRIGGPTPDVHYRHAHLHLAAEPLYLHD